MSSEPQIEYSPKVNDEIKKTTCYMCACRCGINVHIRDDKIRYIEGNRDHPINKGFCALKVPLALCSTIRRHASNHQCAELVRVGLDNLNQ